MRQTAKLIAGIVLAGWFGVASADHEEKYSCEDWNNGDFGDKMEIIDYALDYLTYTAYDSRSKNARHLGFILDRTCSEYRAISIDTALDVIDKIYAPRARNRS